MALTGKALMFALAGVLRAGAGRAGYLSGLPFITLGGVRVGTIRDNPAIGVLVESLQITDILDETPNTCTFTILGMQPTVGQAIVIVFGSVNAGYKEFAGIVLSTEGGYVDIPAHGAVTVHGIDYTYLANAKKVIGRYQTQSATAIAIDLLTRFTSGLTATHVQAGLPTVDEFTVTNQDFSSGMNALAKRIGAYWYIGYDRDLHFFLEESTAGQDPQPITAAHRSLADVRVLTDMAPVVNQVLMEGGGSTVAADCAPGATVIPVLDGVWYPPQGLVAAGPQRLQYSALQQGGVGALVGMLETPSVAPSLALQLGAGVTLGSHQYAYTWVTINGETRPSPVASVTTGAIAAPTRPPVVSSVKQQFHISDEANGWKVGEQVAWTYGYNVADSLDSVTMAAPSASVIAEANTYGGWFHNQATPSPWAIMVRLYYSPDPRVKRIVVWVRIYGVLPDRVPGPLLVLSGYGFVNSPGLAIENGGPGYFDVEYSNIFYSAAPGSFPVANPTYGTVQVEGIATGPTAGSGLLSRKLYRSAAGTTTPLKLVATISGNTITGYTDTLADGALGVNAPATDTAQIPSQAGSVKAGSAALLVTGTGPFLPGGGWVQAASLILRYTGFSGTSSLALASPLPSALNYGVTVRALAALIVPASGAGAVVVPLTIGDELNVIAQADDPALQASTATLLGGDGIIQEYLQDNRLSYTEALARARAHLVLQSRPQVSVGFTCRDRWAQSGRTLSIELTTPRVSGYFKIMQVTIGRFGPHVQPTRTITASSARVSFEDLLRRTKEGMLK